MNFTIIVFSVFLIASCSSSEDVDDSNKKNNYDKIKEVAWNFLLEKGWDERALKDWKNADVKKIIVDDRYALLDNSYEGKEVLAISFEDKGKFVVGPPLILVDSNKIEVIGYLPGE